MVNVCSCFLSCEVTICAYCNSMVLTESTNHLKAYISGIILRPIISILGFFPFVVSLLFLFFFLLFLFLFCLFCLGVPHQYRGHQVTSGDAHSGGYVVLRIGTGACTCQAWTRALEAPFQGVVCLISFSWKDAVWSVPQIIIQYGLTLESCCFLSYLVSNWT